MADFSMFGGINGIPKALECMACSKAIDWVDGVLANKKVVDYVEDAVAALCFISGKFKPRTACKQLVVQFGNPLDEVLVSKLISKDRICNEILGFCQHPKIT